MSFESELCASAVAVVGIILKKELEGKSDAFVEIEPYPDGKVIIGRGAVLDAFIIGITPRAQK